MNIRMTLRPLLCCALLAATVTAAVGGCATGARAPSAVSQERPAALGASMTPDHAAARALLVSPRVLAAAHRVDAATARAEAAAMPPDPTIAISLGVPIDGMGGTPVSLSIMQGIAWLLAHDAIRDAATRERDVAARELVAASVETAAEARRLARALVAARDMSAATRTAAESRHARIAIERDRFDTGESSSASVFAMEREALAADAMLADALLEEHELAVSLESLLAVTELPTIDAIATSVDTVPSADSLEVIRARAAVARAEAMLAGASSPLGTDARAGAGFSRDLEDRESITGTIELGLPIFRRAHELNALRADVAAARADLAEAERVAAIENDHAIARVKGARESAEFARQAAVAARNARSTVENALATGESSRAAVTEARVMEAETQALAAKRRIELAAAIARLEARAAQNTESAGGTR